MRFIQLVTVLSMTLLNPQVARACQCSDKSNSHEDRLAKKEYVFTALATRETASGIELMVDQSLKSTVPKKLEVIFPEPSTYCDVQKDEFKIGTRYLIGINQQTISSSNQLKLGVCDVFFPADLSKKLIESVRKQQPQPSQKKLKSK